MKDLKFHQIVKNNKELNTILSDDKQKINVHENMFCEEYNLDKSIQTFIKDVNPRNYFDENILYILRNITIHYALNIMINKIKDKNNLGIGKQTSNLFNLRANAVAKRNIGKGEAQSIDSKQARQVEDITQEKDFDEKVAQEDKQRKKKYFDYFNGLTKPFANNPMIYQ